MRRQQGNKATRPRGCPLRSALVALWPCCLVAFSPLCLCFSVVFFLSRPAVAEVRVQDVTRLQGQRTNKLMGYGLVVGLTGTGDGEKYLPTMRTLAALHGRYHAPILADADVKGNRSVALVSVEAQIPEHGAREGQAVDVIVSALGTTKSLRGGQLLTTPLQYAMFDPNDPATQAILALAGGPVVLSDDKMATRGVIRDGAVLEADFIYSFIADSQITLVLDEGHADWSWAHMVARAINHELSRPALTAANGNAGPADGVDVALATGPKTIAVRVPTYELGSPARFISSVQQTPLFELPEPKARVTINRTTKEVAFTAGVTVSPAVLQIPGAGTIRIGKTDAEGGKPAPGAVITFDELYQTLTTIKLTTDQMIDAIEHLRETGALHAQVQYR